MKSNLIDKLDLQFCVYGEMENSGEDSYFYSANEDKCISAVFDGCGGLGAQKYSELNNKKGAYIASRTAAAGVEEWFDEYCSNKARKKDIKSYIDKYLQECNKYSGNEFELKGSMVRKFPTTMSAVVIGESGGKFDVDYLWCGDSRGYLFDESGAHQITDDDIDGEDALTNLTNDGVLSNVISFDGMYTVHSKQLKRQAPFMTVTATDGCFGYYRTPMEFEFSILYTLSQSENINDWKIRLDDFIRRFTGDDYTVCIAAVGFGSFRRLKTFYQKRSEKLYDKYISKIENASDKDIVNMWNEYKKQYYTMPGGVRGGTGN
jgi:hypothetical protein